MKRLVALILFGLGCAALAAPSEAGGLPDSVMLVHRLGRVHPTHAMRLSTSGKPDNIHKLQPYKRTHSMQQSTR